MSVKAMTVMKVMMALLSVVSSSSLEDFKHLLRDECIVQMGKKGEYWTSTFQDSISVLFTPRYNADPKITLQQGPHEDTRSWTPPTSEQKWYRGSLMLTGQPVFLTEHGNITFDAFESSKVGGRKWDIKFENVDYCSECPYEMSVIEVHKALSSSQVVVPRSAGSEEMLQILASENTGLNMRVGGVGVSLCRHDDKVVVVSSDTSACPNLLATTLVHLRIEFRRSTVRLSVNGGLMESFNLKNGDNSVKVDKADVNGSVYIIQCLHDCDNTHSSSATYPPVSAIIPTKGSIHDTQSGKGNNTTITLLIVLLVILALSTVVLIVVLVRMKQKAAAGNNMHLTSDPGAWELEAVNSHATKTRVDKVNSIYEPYIPRENPVETINDIYEPFDQIA